MYKVGDRVRIINDLEEGDSYHSIEKVVDEMLEYAGIDAEITDDCGSGLYRLSCDYGEWCWPEKTLIPYVETNGEKIRNMTDEELAKVISCPYKGNEKYHACEKGCVPCCLEWIKKNAE